MTWVAWRLFRTQALVGLGLLAAFAVLVLVTGLHLRDVYDSLGGARCAARGDCSAVTGHDTLIPHLLGPALLAIPALLGMFWGAPLVARELESGTYRLAWTQSVGRRRWLSVRVAVVAVAVLAVAGIASWLVSWWFVPLDHLNANRFDPVVFSERGIVAIGYAGFAFALGVAAGAFMRRTLPAMAATLLGFVAARIAFTFWVRPHLLASSHILSPLTVGESVGFAENGSSTSLFTTTPSIANAWTLSARLVDRAHHVQSAAQLHEILARACPALAAGLPANPGPGATKNPAGLTGGVFVHCLNALSHHLQVLVAYQPASHYWPMQALETGIFLLAALALIGATIWRIERRTKRKPAVGAPTLERPAALVAVTLLALLVAGCGGGGSGVASVGSATTSSTAATQNGPLAYSACMRSHGVPKFPDPNSSGVIPKEQVVAVNPGSPQFEAAQRACQRLQPNGGQPNRAEVAQHLGDMLAFARCMRTHGVANFPDPTSSGELTHETLASAGIDIHQPAVLQAADACVSVTHGALTKAAVARFAAGR